MFAGRAYHMSWSWFKVTPQYCVIITIIIWSSPPSSWAKRDSQGRMDWQPRHARRTGNHHCRNPYVCLLAEILRTHRTVGPCGRWTLMHMHGMFELVLFSCVLWLIHAISILWSSSFVKVLNRSTGHQVLQQLHGHCHDQHSHDHRHDHLWKFKMRGKIDRVAGVAGRGVSADLGYRKCTAVGIIIVLNVKFCQPNIPQRNTPWQSE